MQGKAASNDMNVSVKVIVYQSEQSRLRKSTGAIMHEGGRIIRAGFIPDSSEDVEVTAASTTLRR